MRKLSDSAPGDAEARFFGPFLFHADTLELLRDGRRVALAPKPARLLAALLRQPGRTVSRADLVAELWPGEVVSFDQSLNFTVRELRRALADDARRPRFIETVPRLGYRFVAEVSAADERAATSPPWRRRLTVMVAALAALAAWFFMPRSPALDGGRLASTADLVSPSSARALSLRARDLMQGRHRAPRGVLEAHDLLLEAVQRDPGVAGYWLQLADTSLRLGIGDPDRLAELGRPARRALALDPTSPRAHLRLGDYRSLAHWDWAGARDAYLTALRLDPQLAEAHHHIATHYLIVGEPMRAIQHVERAVELAPVAVTMHGEAAWVHLYAGDAGRATHYAERALTLAPDSVHAARCAFQTALLTGDPAGARTAAERLIAALDLPTDAVRSVEDSGFAAGAVHRACLQALDRDGDTAGERVERALLLAALGRTTEALDELERAAARRMPQLVFRIRDPRLHGLHGEPRFRSLVRRMGIEI